MILGVLSDTHDRLSRLAAALAFFRSRNVDTVDHCGDWKSIETVTYCAEHAHELSLTVHGVLGNNDKDVQAFFDYAEQAPGAFSLSAGVLELRLGGRAIVVYHGHHPPTRKRLLAARTYDVVLLGHTHKPVVIDESSRLIVNPGSTAFAIPRSKSWQPSVALVDLSAMTAEIYYLD